MKLTIVCLLALLLGSRADAQLDVRNRLVADLTPVVAYDYNTGLFKYTYTIASSTQSPQEIDLFEIPLRGSNVVNIASPRGWSGSISPDGRVVTWCACEEEGIVVPPNYVPDGQRIPSTYQVKPGEAFTGFSFESPDAPTGGIFYATGFVLLPIEGIHFPVGGDLPPLPDYPDDAFKGQTQAPERVLDSSFPGGRRPAVDAFLVFMTLKDGDSKVSPVLIDVVFGPNGETVYQQTFRAVLNGVNITDRFVSLDPTRRRAYLSIGTGSTLVVGANTLVTSVDGVVPGATRVATDTDRLRFVVSR